MKLFLQRGGRVGGKYKKCHNFFEEAEETAKKVAVLVA